MTTSSVAVFREKHANADANTVDTFCCYLNGLTTDERLLLRSLLTDDKCTFSKDENTSPFLFNLLNDDILMRIMQEVCKDKGNHHCIFFTSRRMFTFGLPLFSKHLATREWKNAIVSNKSLAAFLQREVRSVVHKTVLLDAIHAHIRDRSLQNNPKNIFQIKTDKTLRTILKLNKNDTLTYLSLPRHLAKYSRKRRYIWPARGYNLDALQYLQNPQVLPRRFRDPNMNKLLHISDELVSFFQPINDEIHLRPPNTLNICSMKDILILMNVYLIKNGLLRDCMIHIDADAKLRTLLDIDTKWTHLHINHMSKYLSCHF